MFHSSSLNECESLCDRIGIMIRGKLRCLGTHIELTSKLESRCTWQMMVTAACFTFLHVLHSQKLWRFWDSSSHYGREVHTCLRPVPTTRSTPSFQIATSIIRTTVKGFPGRLAWPAVIRPSSSTSKQHG